jgi:Fe-S-cluster formation regulator IscX/YfhJ
MTVQELIENLKYLKEEYGADTEVMFSYTASDYWRTGIAQSITDVDLGAVAFSSYHKANKIVDLDDYDEDDREPNSDKKVIIIR